MLVANELINTTPYCVITYVLELEQGKWYVGRTTHLNRRLCEHSSQELKGAIWTAKYPPVSLHEIKIGDLELEQFYVYKDRYGYENVRGSYWCKLDSPTPPQTIEEYRAIVAENKRLERFKSAKLQLQVYQQIESNPKGIHRALLEESFKAKSVDMTIERCLKEPPLIVVKEDLITPIK